jgi:DNA repair protein RecO (recombination protein O)
MGIVRGGRSKRLQPVLQPGNSVDLVWRARLDEHLGQYQVELLNARAGRLMESAIGVHGVQAMAALLRLLPERDSHPRLHDAFAVILDSLDTPQEAGALYVRFELAVLEDLGFGLDLRPVPPPAHAPISSMSRQNRAARFQCGRGALG